MNLDDVTADATARGRDVIQIDAIEGEEVDGLTLIVSEGSTALVFDVGWGGPDGIHSSVTAYSGGEPADPDLLVMPMSLLVRAPQ